MTSRRSFPRCLAALAVASLSFVGACAPSLPSVVRDEMARSPSGTTTLVVFTDFQCPFCRRTHDKIAAALAEHATPARVVLVHVPLRSHPDARTAARTAICSESLLPEDAARAVVDAMYHAADLSEEACERLVVARGADRDRFRACVGSAETQARLARDRAAFVSVGGDGVPLVYIDGSRIDGEPSKAELDVALGETNH